jgi:hypothetical protein
MDRKQRRPPLVSLRCEPLLEKILVISAFMGMPLSTAIILDDKVHLFVTLPKLQ